MTAAVGVAVGVGSLGVALLSTLFPRASLLREALRPADAPARERRARDD